LWILSVFRSHPEKATNPFPALIRLIHSLHFLDEFPAKGGPHSFLRVPPGASAFLDTFEFIGGQVPGRIAILGDILFD
jgi:hypothetical protein